MTSSTIALIITAITMVLFFTNLFPMSVTACLCALAMGILIPEMKLFQIYAGFGGSSVVMVAGMSVVGNAMFQTGMAQRLGAKLGRLKVAQNEKAFIVVVTIICTLMSAFLSNSGTIAMFMPIIAAVAASSNGKIRSKMVIMPAGIARIVGGGSTLVGSTSQVTANSLLMGTAGYEDGMGVFDMTSIMWPICVIQILFWATIGYSILKWALKPERPDFNEGNSFATIAKNSEEVSEDIPKWKGTVSVATLILCIIGFVLSGFEPFNKYLNVAVVSMLGAMIIFVSGAVPVKESLKSLDWELLIKIGAITAMGIGIDVSGAGKTIAEAILGLFGGADASVATLTTVLIIMASVLTLFMTNSSVAALLSSTFIAMAATLGISPLPFIIIIGACSNLAIATHIGTAVNMQILQAGYKPSDYVKIGGPLFLIMVAAMCVIAPIVLF